MPAKATHDTPQRARDRDKRALFIAALRNSANVRASAQAAGVARKTAYRWREKSAAFALEWDEALEDACDTLEASAWKRARDGVTKPVFQQGEHVGDVQEYSDTLLIFLMKAHRPRVYRETVNNRITTWQDDVIAALRNGTLTPEEVTNELGNALADPIIAAVGLIARRKTTEQGEDPTAEVS